jgi:hypothetical protein
MPRNECTYGYVPVGRRTERRVWYVKDGTLLDSKKKPPECPECQRILHHEGRPPAD